MIRRTKKMDDMNIINAVRLISLVKDKPTIWDKSSKNFRNLMKREEAWDDICGTLHPPYKQFNNKQKKLYFQRVRKKWGYVRNTWCRVINEKRKRPPYVYHEQMKFLYKNLNRKTKSDKHLNEDSCLPVDLLYHTGETGEADSEGCSVLSSENSRVSSKKRIEGDSEADLLQVVPEHEHRKNTDAIVYDDCKIEPNMIKIVDVSSLSSNVEENPHVLFMKSLLPSLNKLNEDQILSFQMAVIGILQNVKRGRFSNAP